MERFTLAARHLTMGYLCLMATFFLCFFDESGYIAIMGAKYRCFLGLTCGYFALLVILYLDARVRAGFPIPRPSWRPEPVALCVLLYWFFTLLSTIHSAYPAVAWVGGSNVEGFFTVSLYCLILLAAARYGSPSRWLLYVLGGTVTALSLLAVLQLLGRNPFGLYPKDSTYFDGNISDARKYFGMFLTTIGQADLVSALYGTALPAFAAGLLCLRGKSRFWLTVPLALGMFVLVESTVAAGVVAILFCMYLLPILLVRTRRSLRDYFAAGAALCLGAGLGQCISVAKGGPAWTGGTVGLLLLLAAGVLTAAAGVFHLLGATDGKGLWRTVLVATLLLPVCAAVFLWTYSGPQEGTVYEASQVLHGRFDDSFGAERIRIWRGTWELVQESPLLGGGPDTLGERYEPYQKTYLSGGQEQTVYLSVTKAHNEFLNTWVCQGLFALLAWLAVLALSFWRWLRRGRALDGRSVAAVAVLGYVAQSLFCYSVCITAPLLYVAVGMMQDGTQSFFGLVGETP